MPELTRRRVHDEPESWHIYYDGVRVGVISRRSGNPLGTAPWRWSCGFYPGGRPGEDRDGTAPTFEDARTAFAEAWRGYLPKHIQEDFETCRRFDESTAAKYAEWDRLKAATRIR